LNTQFSLTFTLLWNYKLVNSFLWSSLIYLYTFYSFKLINLTINPILTRQLDPCDSCFFINGRPTFVLLWQLRRFSKLAQLALGLDHICRALCNLLPMLVHLKTFLDASSSRLSCILRASLDFPLLRLKLDDINIQRLLYDISDSSTMLSYTSLT